MLTRKHYIDLAEVLRTLRGQDYGSGVRDRDIADEVLDDLTEVLVAYLKRDNPRFDAERFRRAADADRIEYAEQTEGEE